MMRSRNQRVRNTARRALDGLSIVALLLMLLIGMTGGFDLSLWGQPISAHRSSRPFVIFVMVVAIRWYFFGREYRSLRRSRELLYQPSVDIRPATRLVTRDAVWALLGICAVAALLLHNQLLNMRAVPDFGDPLFSVWRLGWVGHWTGLT